MAWYEKERAGLGAEFHKAIDAALDIIVENVVPLSTVPGIAASRGVKRLVLRRFPYSVIVRETREEVIVIAFAHTSRRPGYWKNRIRRTST